MKVLEQKFYRMQSTLENKMSDLKLAVSLHGKGVFSSATTLGEDIIRQADIKDLVPCTEAARTAAGKWLGEAGAVGTEVGTSI
jgi:hypothetical protein